MLAGAHIYMNTYSYTCVCARGYVWFGVCVCVRARACADTQSIPLFIRPPVDTPCIFVCIYVFVNMYDTGYCRYGGFQCVCRPKCGFLLALLLFARYISTSIFISTPMSQVCHGCTSISTVISSSICVALQVDGVSMHHMCPRLCACMHVSHSLPHHIWEIMTLSIRTLYRTSVLILPVVSHISWTCIHIKMYSKSLISKNWYRWMW